MSDAVFCEHANENPQLCRCQENCYCKAHTCKGREGLIGTRYPMSDLAIGTRLPETDGLFETISRKLKAQEELNAAVGAMMASWKRQHKARFQMQERAVAAAWKAYNEG